MKCINVTSQTSCTDLPDFSVSPEKFQAALSLIQSRNGHLPDNTYVEKLTREVGYRMYVECRRRERERMPSKNMFQEWGIEG